MVICYCDGGAAPNPGECYGSFRITGLDNGIIVQKFEYGYGTNNQAEYKTLLKLLQYLRGQNVDTAIIRMDAQLVMKQIRGTNSVYNPGLKPLHKKAMALLSDMNGIEFQYVHNKKMKQILGH